MANKKYNEFPAGVYDTAKIFLQADPVTGALEKVNLPSVTGGGGSYSESVLKFTATEAQTTFQDDLLKGATIKKVFFDGFLNVIAITLNSATGVVTFSEALNLNIKVSIFY